MPRRLRRLAPRLILALTLLVAVVEGVFGWVNATIQERELVAEVVRGADQLSRSITSATWHAMRADRRADAYEVMQTIAEKQGVEGIRIFNKQGVVAFSTGGDAGSRVTKGAPACAVCHEDGSPLRHVDVASRAAELRAADGRRQMKMVTAIYNEAACGVTDCHPPPDEQAVLGVLDVILDLSHVDDDVGAMKLRTVLMAAIHITLVGLFIAFFTSRFVARPIRRLVAATRDIGAMELDRPIRTGTTTELADLERSFDAMRQRLKDALQELHRLTEGLERKVEQRDEQLQHAQEKLIQSDRMATLGQLCASVAHEINNPVSGVLNLSMLMQRILAKDGVPPGRVEEFRRYLAQVSEETTRVGRIVSDLLSFSRRSSPNRAPADIHAVIERTVSLVAHKLSLAHAEAVLDLSPDVPEVPCDRSQLEQVVLNLLMNAVEAMPQGGKVFVRTRVDVPAGAVVIEIEDEGTGIPKEHLSRIFDPFFSTKEAGKGTGLGLTVVYGIVDAHGGTIDVRSTVGKGTTFTVRLPLRPPGAAAAAAVGAAPATATAAHEEARS